MLTRKDRNRCYPVVVNYTNDVIRTLERLLAELKAQQGWHLDRACSCAAKAVEDAGLVHRKLMRLLEAQHSTLTIDEIAARDLTKDRAEKERS